MSIEFENTVVTGWEAAIRGMRNPMNSWDKSDSPYGNYLSAECEKCGDYEDFPEHCDGCGVCVASKQLKPGFNAGPNDHFLMMQLRDAGTDHRKFMRMIAVYVDITAPLYWWKEFDTYKVGTVANSCSTMHTITYKEFALEDFSHDHLTYASRKTLQGIIDELNRWRNLYLNGVPGASQYFPPKDKEYWWHIVQLLPSSYNQKRTVMLNYEVLANIYKSRKNHKLDEWAIGFMDWIKSLPCSELITG